jgi:hypothetical protein
MMDDASCDFDAAAPQGDGLKPDPDKDQMLQHLTLLHGRALVGRIEITSLSTDEQKRPRTRFFGVDELEAAVEYAAAINAEHGRNVYVGAALRHDDVRPGKAATDDDFQCVYVAWADADDAQQVEHARKVYRDRGLTPSFVVVTGRAPETRAQMYWPLEEPITDIEVHRATERGIAQSLGTDRSVCTGKQLMRLGGSVAWPKKNKPGRMLERTELIRPSGAAAEFSLEQLSRAFPPIARGDAAAGPIPEMETARTGSLGLDERIMDGREGYAFRLTRGHLHELLGTTGAAPTPDELYASVAPVFLAKTDQTRGGRGPKFLMQKCVEAVRAFHAGQIPFARTLDEAVQSYARKAQPEPEPGQTEDGKPRFRFNLTFFNEIAEEHHKSWLVRDLFGAGEFSIAYGAPGSGKSVLLGDGACHVAAGLPWFGMRTQQCAVIYVAAERHRLVKRRMAAWRKHHGRNDIPVVVLDGLFNFATDTSHGDEIVRIAEHVRVVTGHAVGWLIIDTKAQVMGGADENSSRDISVLNRNIAAIQQTGAHVTIVDHTPQADPTRMKGNGGLAGAADGSFLVIKENGVRVLRIGSKAPNDGPDNIEIVFGLEGVVLGVNADGEQTEAPVVVPAQRTESDPKPDDARHKGDGAGPQGANQKAVMAALRKAKGRPLGLTALAAMIGKDNSAVTHAVTALKAKGLVREVGDDGPKRWVLA